MIFWLILFVWLIGWAWSTVWMARALKEMEIRRCGLAVATENEHMDLAVGACIALLWPVTGPIWLLIGPGRTLKSRIMRTETERSIERHRAAVDARETARRLGLPYPGENR